MSKTKTKIITKETEDVNQENEPQIKIAVMNNDIKHVNDTLTRIENKFDTAIQGFVTVDKLSDVIQANDIKHLEQDKRIDLLENWNIWAIRILGGTILTAILSFVAYVIAQHTH